MINREAILRKVNKIDDKLLVAKMLDKANQAEGKRIVVNTQFLDPYQRSVVEKALSNSDDIDYIFDGGYTGAERVIVIFRPNFMSFDEEDYESPFKSVNVKVNNREALSHRDYLGALMSLGIKREMVGDILVKDDTASIVVMDEIADFIKYNLSKIGNSRITVTVDDIGELEAPEPSVKEISTTIASLRLDCVVSAGFGISRSKVTDFIKAEKVNLNWEMTDSLIKQVKEGDTISIRGKGRVILETVGRETRKGRIGVVLRKLI